MCAWFPFVTADGTKPTLGAGIANGVGAFEVAKYTFLASKPHVSMSLELVKAARADAQ